MIGIQIITHGKMAEGLLDTAEMIVGYYDKVEYNTLSPDQDFDLFQEEVLNTTKHLDDGDGVLIFVDMFGASPYKASVINSQEIENVDLYKVISGVNLPLLIEALLTRENMEINELYKHLLNTSATTISGWEV